MGKKIKKSLAIFLSVALVLTCIPAIAFAAVEAADGQDVITGATHETYPVNVTDKVLTITVPYDFDETVNVAYIKPVWDESVKEPSLEWGGGYATVAVDGTVTGTAKYKVGDGDTVYTSTYTAKVVAKEKQNPTASGTINKSVQKETKLTFETTDFTSKYNKNDGKELEKIVIADKVGAENSGEFNLGEESYVLGTEVEYINFSKLSYKASSSGSNNYVVSYYESGNSTSVGTVDLKITVENPAIPNISGGAITQKETAAFPVEDVNKKFKETSSSPDGFDKLIFTELPASTKGTLYTTSSKETAAVKDTEYGMDAFLGDGMLFVPNSSYTGTVDIKYSVYDGSECYNGKVTFTVVSSEVADITASIAADETYTVPRSDINTKVKAVSGNSAVNYVVFTNASSVSKGNLYYDGSSKITSNTAKYYYTGSSSKNYLSKVTFVPSGSTGTSTIKYKAYTEDGNYYNGEIVLTISEASTDLPLITYNVDKGGKLKLSVSDFKTALSNQTSKSLDYVKFELPPTNRGTLYYDYTSSSNYDSKVGSSTKYYASGSSKKLISDVTFVPKSTYTGSFYIKYTAYNSSGTEYNGEIRVNVRDSEYSLPDITYETSKNAKLNFDVSDFKTALNKKSDENLDYVKFELPSTSYGTLYYDYTSSSNYDSKVAASTKYYRTGSSKKLISDVTFVPKSGFTGSVTINYDAFDDDGVQYEGSIVIKIGSSGKLEDITYKVDNTKVLTLSATDINTKFKAEDGSNFSYVKFTLPSSTYGYLYHDYKSAEDPGSFVKSSDKYYRTGSSNDLVSEVTYEPKSGYKGTFSLKYTAYNSDGASYEGVIKITVGAGLDDREKSEYFTDVTQDYDWVAAKIDYLYKNNIVKGTETTSAGMKYSPAAKITRGDFILMLYRAFDLKAAATDNFTDVPKSSYYYDAIGAAKALGIAQGAYGKFNPTDSLTREDAMVLIYRAIDVKGNKTLPSNGDVSKLVDKAKISDYAVSSVGTLVKAGVINGYEDSTFKPKGYLTRAEMAVVLYNVEML